MDADIEQQEMMLSNGGSSVRTATQESDHDIVQPSASLTGWQKFKVSSSNKCNDMYEQDILKIVLAGTLNIYHKFHIGMLVVMSS